MLYKVYCHDKNVEWQHISSKFNLKSASELLALLHLRVQQTNSPLVALIFTHAIFPTTTAVMDEDLFSTCTTVKQCRGIHFTSDHILLIINVFFYAVVKESFDDENNTAIFKRREM